MEYAGERERPMPELTYPTPTGPFPVGFADGEVIDQTYPRTSPAEQDGRRLPLRVWYPAVPGTQGPAWRGDTEVFVAYGNPATISAEWMEKLSKLAAHGRQEVAVAAGSWPALLYSHGAGGFLDQSVALMEELASHGYVVVCFAHPGGACAVRGSDGTLTLMDAELLAQITATFTPMVTAFLGDVDARLAHIRSGALLAPDGRNLNDRWADDFRAVLDALHTCTVDGPAAAVLPSCDLSRVAAGGFSWSGPAATLVAHQDDRLAAGLNVDGGDWRPELADTHVRCPTLALSSEQIANIELMIGTPIRIADFHELSYEPLSSAGTRPDVHRLLIEGAAHAEYTDIALLPASVRAGFPGAGTVETDYVVERTHAVILGFLDRYLRETGDFPASQIAAFPGIQLVDLQAIRQWAAARASALPGRVGGVAAPE